MKTLLILFMTMASFCSFAQNPEATDTIDKEADRLANAYDNELAFTSEQFLLFKNELKSTLQKRRLIEKQFKGKEKLEQLMTMQAYESSAMGEILTRIQFRRYIRIKPRIQPLDVIE